jgi:hypothetical protein
MLLREWWPQDRRFVMPDAEAVRGSTTGILVGQFPCERRVGGKALHFDLPQLLEMARGF